MPDTVGPLNRAAAGATARWLIVAASAIGLIFSQGTLITYSISVFVQPLTAEFGWSRTQIAGGLASAQYALALSAPVWGLLVDRFGPRRVLVPSVVMLSLLVGSLYALRSDVTQFYVVLAAVSLFAGGASPLGYSAVLIRRFDRQLGLALGLALMGVGLGAVVVPRIAGFMVADFGWREAYLAIGVATLVVTLPAALLASSGLRGVSLRARAAAAPVGGMVLSRTFILICAVFAIFGAFSVGALSQLVSMMRDHGFTQPEAVGVASLTGIAVIVGRGGIGWVMDQVHAPFVVAVVALGASASFLLLGFTSGPSEAYVAALLLGLTIGAEVDFITFLIRCYFPPAAFGRLYGVAFGLFILGTGTGPLILAASFDRLGGYRPGLIAFAVMGAVAAGLAVAMPRYERPRAGALKA